MKHLFTILLIGISSVVLAQAPRVINYQGVLRNNLNAPLPNKAFTIRFQLFQNNVEVFSEVQNAQTNELGLFSTQIGKINTVGMSTLNISGSDLSLQVAIDTASGSSFVDMGARQDLATVPYAMYALTVPSSYTNDVLSIGDKTYTIAQPQTPTLTLNSNVLGIVNSNTVQLESYVAGNGISISGGPEYTLSAASPTIQGQGVANVTSTGSDFTVSVPGPSLTSNGNTVTISQGTVLSTATVGVIQPTLSVSGNTLVLLQGTTPASATLPPNVMTVTATGSLATITTPTVGNSFNINVATPSLSLSPNGNSLSIAPGGNTVALPAYSLSTNSNSITLLKDGSAIASTTVPPSFLTLSGSGVLSHTLSAGGNSLALPTFTTGSGLTMTGSGPVFTISSAAVSTTFTSQGIAQVSPATGTLINVNVPAAALTYTNNVLTHTQGSSVTAVTIPPPTLTLSGAGNNALTAGTNTVTLNTYTVSGPGISMSGGPNYTITSAPPSPTVRGFGLATVTPTVGTDFSVTVQPPVLSYNAATRSLSVAHGTVNNGVVVAPSLSITGANNNSLTAGSNTITLNTYSAGAGLQLTGTAPNYVLSSTTGTTRISGLGAVQVSSASPSSFTVDVPNPAITYTNNSMSYTQGTFNVVVPMQPTLALSGANNNSLTAGANTLVLNTYSAGAGMSLTGAAPNYVLSSTLTPALITGVGAAQVTTAAPHSFTVTVPTLTYDPATGVLAQGTNTTNLNPALGFTSGVLSVGHPSNSIDLSAVSPWTVSAGNAILTNTTANVGIGTTSPAEDLQVESGSNLTQASILSAASGTSMLSFGESGANHFRGILRYDNAGDNMDFFTNNTHRLRIDANGNMGLRTNTMTYDLNLFNTGTSVGMGFRHSSSAGNGFVIGHNTAGTSLLSYENLPVFFGANSVNLMSLQPNGHLRIGNNTPVDPNTALLVSRNGAFDNRVVITGGDNNNNFGGILTLSENLNQSQGMSMRLEVGGNRLQFTNDFAGNNPVLTVGGYSGANSGVAIGSAYGFVQAPVNGLIVQGNLGVGTNTLGGKFHVDVTNASFKITDYPPGGGPIINTVLMAEMFGKGGNGPQMRLMALPSSSWMDIGLNGNGDFVVEGDDNQHLVVTNSGNVGVGTNAPGINTGAARYLTVSSTKVYSNNMAALELEGSFMGTLLPFAKIDFNTYGASSLNVARISGYNAGVVGQGVLSFETHNGTALLERMRIQENGRVGINTTNPTTTLHVNGNVRITDGTQGARKVLTSDASGVASWQDVLPAGVIMAYGGPIIPAGWALCDGASQLRTDPTYAALFAAIGTSWGAPSGTTFNLPDMRGMFLRGVAGTAPAATSDPESGTRLATKPGGNTGNNVGSLQNDQLQSHNHTLPAPLGSTTSAGLLGGGPIVYDPAGSFFTSSTGGTETRPVNVYVYYIIKL